MSRMAVLVLAAALLASVAAVPGSAHRAVCHARHECPSDHATYRWRGMLCVKPTSEKRTARFKIRVRYDGRTYWCRR